MPQIERDAPTPLYQQARDWIADQINFGVWPEHYKLKSEQDLAIELGVNRGTLRKAIADLIAEGKLVSIHGRGTFVASSTLEQPLAERLVAVSEDLIAKDIPFETRVLDASVIQPPQRVTSLLSISSGTPVFCLKRVRIVRHIPLILLTNYVVYDQCHGIEKVDFTQQRLFDTLEHEFKLALDWGRRAFQAQVADETVATLLELAVHDPVMYLEQLVYLRDGSPIELSDVWLRGDRFRVSAIVKRGTLTTATNTHHEYSSTAEIQST